MNQPKKEFNELMKTVSDQKLEQATEAEVAELLERYGRPPVAIRTMTEWEIKMRLMDRLESRNWQTFVFAGELLDQLIDFKKKFFKGDWLKISTCYVDEFCPGTKQFDDDSDYIVSPDFADDEVPDPVACDPGFDFEFISAGPEDEGGFLIAVTRDRLFTAKGLSSTITIADLDKWMRIQKLAFSYGGSSGFLRQLKVFGKDHQEAHAHCGRFCDWIVSRKASLRVWLH